MMRGKVNLRHEFGPKEVKYVYMKIKKLDHDYFWGEKLIFWKHSINSSNLIHKCSNHLSQNMPLWMIVYFRV